MKTLQKEWMLLWLIFSISLLLVNACVVLIDAFRIDKLTNKKEPNGVLVENIDQQENNPYHDLYFEISDAGISGEKEMSNSFNHVNSRNEFDTSSEFRITLNVILQLLVIALIVPSFILIFLKLNRLKKVIGYKNLLIDQKNFEVQNSKHYLSHIIRGPICRLQGLLHLLERENEGNKNLLIEKIEKVTAEIDELTKLN